MHFNNIQKETFSSTHFDSLLQLKPSRSLIPCGKKAVNAEVVTEHAVTCFKEIQKKQSSLGLSSFLWKSTAVNATYLAHFAIPTAALGSYLYLRGWEQVGADIVTVLKAAYTPLSIILKPTADWLENTTKENPFMAMTGLGMCAINELYAPFKVRPITSTLKWVGGTLALGSVLAYLELAKTNKDMVYNRFANNEKDLKKALEKDRSHLLDHLIKIFNRDADKLLNQFNVAQHDPRDLYQLKQLANDLEGQLPVISGELTKLELSSAETSQILNSLSEAIRTIQNAKLEVKSSNSDLDNEYNAKLMITLPVSSKTSMTAQALKQIQTAKANKLGIMHTAKSYAASALSGIASSIAVPAAAYAATLAHAEAYNVTTKKILAFASEGAVDNDWMVPAAAVAGTAVVALTAGALIGNSVSASYSKERRQHDATVALNNGLAKAETFNLYDGIANYFDKQKRISLSKDLVAQAIQLQAKLPEIHKQILKSKIEGLKPEEATEKLQVVLAEIISSSQG